MDWLLKNWMSINLLDVYLVVGNALTSFMESSFVIKSSSHA